MAARGECIAKSLQLLQSAVEKDVNTTVSRRVAAVLADCSYAARMSKS